MKNTLVAFIVLIVLLVGLGLIYIYSGSYNVAANEELEGLTRWVFSTTTMASIQARAEPLELQADSAMIHEGGHHFREMCAGCHGGPGVEAKWVGKGLNPEPPDLSESAEELSTGELYWIAEHGIKHTGMPALAPTHDEKEIRAIVAFIEQLPDLSEQDYQMMTAHPPESDENPGHRQ